MEMKRKVTKHIKAGSLFFDSYMNLFNSKPAGYFVVLDDFDLLIAYPETSAFPARPTAIASREFRVFRFEDGRVSKIAQDSGFVNSWPSVIFDPKDMQ